MSKEYRVEVKVKNNKILKKIEQAGYATVGEFCRLNGKMSWASRIGDYVNLKETPLNAEGDFFPHVYEICNLLNCSPEDLFSEVQLQTAIESNKRTLEVNEAEMRFMLENQTEVLALEDQIAKDRMPDKVAELLDTLTPREKKVIQMRFGLDGCEPATLEETGRVFDVTRDRIRQIEAKALRKLRHPTRANLVKEYVDEDFEADDNRWE